MNMKFLILWQTKKNRKAFRKFLDELVSRPDVWIVSQWEMIQWLKNPTPQSQMSTFDEWKTKCDTPVPLVEQACNIPHVCKLFSRELRKQRYLYTCNECPDTYPWIKNEFGLEFKKK